MKKELEYADNRSYSVLVLDQTLPRLLLNWYDNHARFLPWRKDTDPYHVWLSEIMLQQTRVETVKVYYIRFLEQIPTIMTLADADEEKLLKLWEGLGYYSRVRNLQKAARVIINEYGGCFPDTYEQLIKLPGVGAYTAGAIASICFGQPTPAVDGNVLRIIARIAGISECIDTPVAKKRVTDSLARIYPQNRCGDLTQSLMELGATVCIPNGIPRCTACPAADLCKANRENAVLDYPVKKEKTGKREQEVTVLMLFSNNAVAIRRRDKQGLLAGLWELPNVQEKLDEQYAFKLAAGWGTEPVSLVKSVQRIHIFTHIKWLMTCYYIECAAKADGFIWADPDSLEETYALPTAFKKFTDIFRV